MLNSGDKQEKQFVGSDFRVEGSVFGGVVFECSEMGWEICGGGETDMEVSLELGDIVSSGDAVEAKHRGKDSWDSEGGVTVNGVCNCAGIERANGSDNCLFEESSCTEKVVALVKSAFENSDSCIGGVVGEVSGNWVGRARDEDRGEGVCVVIM